MKLLITCLFTIVAISGCATNSSTPSAIYTRIPKTPEPHAGKFAVQFVKVELQNNVGFDPSYPKSVERIYQNPSNEITEYPILYVGTGVAVTNDQTKTVVLPEDFNIVDGKAVPNEKSYKLGFDMAVTISKVENDRASLKLNFNQCDLKGYDVIVAEGGIEVHMPQFKLGSMNTDVSIKLGGWVVLGGIGENPDDKKGSSTLYLIRVI